MVASLALALLVACNNASFSGNAARATGAKPTATATGGGATAGGPNDSPENDGQTGGGTGLGNPGGPGSSPLGQTTQPGGSTAGGTTAGGAPGGTTAGAATSSGSLGSVPTNAVTQGSFTAFADPANPGPFQDYNIHIRVTLPSGTAGYQQSDLTGTIAGSDGYTQSITQSITTGTGISADGKTNKVVGTPQFSVQGDTAELVIAVPGAAAGTQDTISVHSSVLNQNASIQLVFN